MDLDLPKLLKTVLGARSAAEIPSDTGARRRAGVLVPLLPQGDRWRVIMIKRTETVEQHKGQISFPGGGVEPVDTSLEETALREAEEEIGLRREDVEILGRLDDAMTLTSRYIVHPFVGLVPSEYAFTLNRIEVDRIIRVPLEIFHPANLEARRSEVPYRGARLATPGYAYDGDVIWGATARIMENFMSLVGDKLLLPERRQ